MGIGSTFAVVVVVVVPLAHVRATFELCISAE